MHCKKVLTLSLAANNAANDPNTRLCLEVLRDDGRSALQKQWIEIKWEPCRQASPNRIPQGWLSNSHKDSPMPNASKSTQCLSA